MLISTSGEMFVVHPLLGQLKTFAVCFWSCLMYQQVHISAAGQEDGVNFILMVMA